MMSIDFVSFDYSYVEIQMLYNIRVPMCCNNPNKKKERNIKTANDTNSNNSTALAALCELIIYIR